MRKTYDIAASVVAQKNFAKRYANAHPEDPFSGPMSRGVAFAPRDGFCYRCHKNIYSEGGISLDQAANHFVTGCPFCHISYVG